jgi:imidazolonepropionase-like amidohydrolase
MFVIVNAEIDPVARPRISGGTVLVKNGRIAAVGKSVAIPRGAERIDAKGRLLTPGLIDPHTHAGLAEDGMPGDHDVNEKTDPITPQIRAIDAFRPTDAALLEAAQSGVTAAFITPGSANVVGGMGAVVKTLAPTFDKQVVRLDAGLKMAFGENPKRVYGEQKRMPSSRMGTAAVLRQALTSAQDYERKRSRGGKATKDTPDVDLGKETLCRLLAREFPARCHAHRSIDMLTAMRISEEFGFDLIFEHATECRDILPELAARKIPVILGPSFGGRSKVELHQKGFESVPVAVGAGLRVSITADTDITPLRYLSVYAALAIREGLAPEDAMRAITLNAATICGVEKRMGSIQRGRDADLVLWEGDPFDARTRPASVWISGRPVDMTLQAFTRWR